MTDPTKLPAKLGYPPRPKHLKPDTPECEQYRIDLEAALLPGHTLVISKRGTPYVVGEDGKALTAGWKPASGVPAMGPPNDPAIRERFMLTTKAEVKLQKRAFMQGYAEAVSTFMPLWGELQKKIYEDGIKPDSTPQQVNMAYKLMVDTIDRLGSKATSTLEVEVGGDVPEDSWLAQVNAAARARVGQLPPAPDDRDVVDASEWAQ